MSRNKFIYFIGLTALIGVLTACSKNLPTITSSSSQQLTDELVLQARLSKDNKLAYLLTRGPVFTIWDISNLQPINSIPIESLARGTRNFVLSDNQTRLLTSNDKSVLLWSINALQENEENVANFKVLGSLDLQQQLGDANITSMAFISDSLFVIGNSDGSMIFADLQNNVFRQSQFHTSEVVGLIAGHEKRHLYSAGNDGRVVVTDLTLYELKNEYTVPFRITSLISNDDNSLLFFSDALASQVFWQPWQNEVVSELDYWQQYRFFRKGLFINDDKQIVTTSPKTEISIWNVETGEEEAKWQAAAHSLGTAVMDIQQLTDNEIITLTSDSVIEVWDLNLLK